MAQILLDTPGGFPEGAYFHLCHAFECAVVGIFRHIAPHKDVPDGHPDKVAEALDVVEEQDSGLADDGHSIETRLGRRNRSLYVKTGSKRLTPPHQSFHMEPVRQLHTDVAVYVKRIEEQML